ncbi:hypothetical protein FS837_012515 [Tulasnella sp. UAMH 9824]|nr:hypothetical protein FS837_012515 [Tulasnella sp. UAMH 9824]
MALPTSLVYGFPSFVLLLLLRHAWNRRHHYPPGPPQDPLIGNLRNAPKEKPCLTWEEWGKTYGPLIYMNVAGKPYIIINSYDVARELLEKRGGKYSDRPRFVMAGELVGLGIQTALAPFGMMWRRHRKFFAASLSPHVVAQNYSSIHERKAYQFIQYCLDRPEQYRQNIKRMSGEAVNEITYGASRNEEHDFVDLNEELSSVTAKVMQGYWVEFLPWLKYVPEWMPGAQFKRDARKWRAQYSWTRNYLLDTVRKAVASGHPFRTSYVSSLLQAVAKSATRQEDEGMIASSGFTFYRAANDTTVSALNTFLVAMSLYPEVQAKAREELDRAVGDRLPSLADRPELPYIFAIVQEVLRWVPPFPNGLPHRLMEEDTYEGYYIPPGATVFANLWAMSRDPNMFENPDKFDPDRYYNGTAKLDSRDFVFGFGRRVCPGNHLAIQGIFMTVATILWSFEIKDKSPVNKRNMDSRQIFNLNFTAHPEPYNISLEPRRANLQEFVARGISEREALE